MSGCTVPAASTAIFLLFSMVTDELEESAEGDTLWLDAALNVLQTKLNRPLVSTCAMSWSPLIRLQRRHPEHRRLRAAVKSIPRGLLRELTDLGVEQLRAEVVSVVGACVAYQEELERLFEESTARRPAARLPRAAGGAR